MNFTSQRKSSIKKTIVRLLYECNIHELPINLNTVIDHYNYNLFTYNKIMQLGFKPLRPDGYTITVRKDEMIEYTIVYDSSLSPQRIRWTIAHEIGHIHLNHLTETYAITNPDREAQYFAEQLLMPLPVISTLGTDSVQRIMSLCNVSSEAAQWRMNDLKRHYSYRNRYGLTEDDKAFLRQFRIQ